MEHNIDRDAIQAAAQAVQVAQVELDRTKGNLQQLVNNARRHGDSWGTIGSYLGITRQAAWERFKEGAKE